MAENNVIVRIATSDDMPALLDMVRGLARYEKAEHEVKVITSTHSAVHYASHNLPYKHCASGIRDISLCVYTPGDLNATDDCGAATAGWLWSRASLSLLLR